MAPNSSIPDAETAIDPASPPSPIDELDGSLAFQDLDDKFMHSVLENDKSIIEDGKLIENAINQGIGSFTPDLLFEQLVQNYSIAENIYGKAILRQLFGYDPDYIQNNIQIPEFKRLLRKKLGEKLLQLQRDELLDKQCHVTNKGIELASLVMYVEELDHLVPKGMAGERFHDKESHYGGREEVRRFRKGDRYRDLALRKSVHAAVRHGCKDLLSGDLRSFQRTSKGQCAIIYAIDASGSMKGDKIASCKKAGIALAYKAIQNKDNVGLIVFGDTVKAFVEPTSNFPQLLKELASVRASQQTDIVQTIRKATELFPSTTGITKHLLIMTDAIPTVGNNPEQETLEAVAIAKNKGITISIIGISLDEAGARLAEQAVRIGGGKLYIIKDLGEMDRIVLEDYYGA